MEMEVEVYKELDADCFSCSFPIGGTWAAGWSPRIGVDKVWLP